MSDPTAVPYEPPVPPAWVLEHARAAVGSVVSAVWPGEPVVLGPQIPSVTNYVTALQVNRAGYVAKYSVLGTSLVSVVRGLRGDWAAVLAAQRDYVSDPHGQLARERAQLRALAAHTRRAEAGLRVPQVIAHQDGVLITTAVGGSSLATELLRGRRGPEELLAGVVAAADRLHQDRALAAVSPAMLAHPHTSIAATYTRKFLSPTGARYLAALGAGWADPPARRRIQHALAALRPTLAPLLARAPSGTVIYGDLKPEHVLLSADGSRQTWIDPGLQWADPTAELAKLISRVALALITAHPSPARVTAVTDAIHALVTEHVATRPRPTLRRLVALWLADWASYLASGLSLPPESGLPLPPTLLGAAGHAGPLLGLAAETAAGLRADPGRAWGAGLRGIRRLASGEHP